MLKLENKQKVVIGIGVGIASILSFVGLYRYYYYIKEKRQLEAEQEDLEVSSIYNRGNDTGFRVITTHEDAGRGVREKGRMRISGRMFGEYY